MAKQTFTAGQVLTAAEMNSLQENDYNWTVTTKTASYVLAAGDEGTRIVMNSGSATTITVDDAVFAAGDVVWIHNIGAGTCTVTAGTATVNTAASLDLAQWEGGSLYFTSASSAIFFRGPAGGVANANFTDTATGTFSSGGTDYKYLVFKSSGTITFDTAGLADFLVVAGGGGGNAQNNTQLAAGAGGAGGVIDRTGFYIEAGTYTVTVGAGGTGGTGLPSALRGNDSSVGTILQAMAGGGGGQGTHTSSVQTHVRNSASATGGGSGGGAGANTAFGVLLGGLGVPGQGFEGSGMGTGGGHYMGGGGGGAGARGEPTAYAAGATNNVAADGGVGATTTIITDTIATAQSVGEVDSGNVYFGGGGGGAAHITTYCGTGGLGGGADAPTTAAAGNAGTANTGGGGSGGRDQVSGGNGGSGCVIVRVAV